LHEFFAYIHALFLDVKIISVLLSFCNHNFIALVEKIMVANRRVLRYYVQKCASTDEFFA